MVMVAFIGGIGGWELMLVVAAILVIFGPDRLPEIVRKFASLTRKVRTANRDFQREMYRNLDPDEILNEQASNGDTPASGESQGRNREIEEESN